MGENQKLEVAKCSLAALAGAAAGVLFALPWLADGEKRENTTSVMPRNLANSPRSDVLKMGSDLPADVRSETLTGLSQVELEASDLNRMLDISEEFREFLVNDEMRRIEVVGQSDDANSSITLLLKRPEPEDLLKLIKQFVKRLRPDQRAIVEQAQVRGTLEIEVRNFYDYGRKCRYMKFELPGSGSAILPAIEIIESDEIHEAEDFETGLPPGSVRVKRMENLNLNSDEIRRYGKLFKID